ncbi:hypothetical protein GCM10010497_21990 [Streptomyces cinereoruber]|uniref:Uncharacterized protein n=1 Tax=Streptomyces cinereoruber TaxID=67260 RepID=A0AAV4KET3_9ACTN|nr:hypothetical protein GCM10010497_21990 [Streptomyces cinereoruber]
MRAARSCLTIDCSVTAEEAAPAEEQAGGVHRGASREKARPAPPGPPGHRTPTLRRHTPAQP